MNIKESLGNFLGKMETLAQKHNMFKGGTVFYCFVFVKYYIINEKKIFKHVKKNVIII